MRVFGLPDAAQARPHTHHTDGFGVAPAETHEGVFTEFARGSIAHRPMAGGSIEHCQSDEREGCDHGHPPQHIVEQEDDAEIGGQPRYVEKAHGGRSHEELPHTPQVAHRIAACTDEIGARSKLECRCA